MKQTRLVPVPREIRRALKLPKTAKIEHDGKDHLHETWTIVDEEGSKIGVATKLNGKWTLT